MQASQVSIDPDEIAKFEAMAEEWWDPNGKFKPLHMLNPCRLDYIIAMIRTEFGCDPTNAKPFNGLRILDIGCGGGLLCEPMARLGAKVVGVDAAERNIPVATAHAKQSNLKIDYRHGTAESLLADTERFDVILNMEVVEHVDNLNTFLYQTSKLLNNSGIMFVATINKTLKSYIFAIVGAEYILRWLPIGTHEWEKFVKPQELKDILNENNLSLKKFDGMHFNIIKDEWSITKDLSVNYIAKFLKN